MWNVVQIKTLYQHFSAQICLLKQLYFIPSTKFYKFQTYLKCQLPNSCTPFIMVDYLNHFDNYFVEIASFHKHETRLASLQKYYLTRLKTSLGEFL